MALKLEDQLKEVGSKLQTPPPSKDALLKLLKQAVTCLSELEQAPPAPVLESIQPLFNVIVKLDFLKHQDREVKLLVASSICEITRITAPEAPYTDDVLKDIFHLIVETFSGLSDTSGSSFGRRVVILETVAKYRSCVVMLDLECDDLVKEMFYTFFSVARDDHPENVLLSMRKIMVLVLEETEDVHEDLLLAILSNLGRNRSVTMAARKLAMDVIEHCAHKVEADIRQLLVSLISGDGRWSDCQIDYHEVFYDIYRCAPQILSGVVPYITGELLTDQLDTRLKVVNLIGDLFALAETSIGEAFQPVFSEFLKRLTDRVVEVRMAVLEHVRSCLLSDPARAEAPHIIAALCDRLLDYDENVRKQVVAVICDVACHASAPVPVDIVKLVAERLRDKAILVKNYTAERLAELFRVHSVRSAADSSIEADEFDWIPGKILRCFYDKDFRSETIEFILGGSLFPSDFSVKNKVKIWIRVFSGLDRVEVKALEKILEQKQRLQQDMQKYLSLRQAHKMQDGDAPETQKKIVLCFRFMSRSFYDLAKAEENFLVLDQLKDANIWKILTNLVDPNTSIHQASSSRDDLLKVLGEKHQLYDFLGTLSLKCSYLIFSKEHAKDVLMEVSEHKSDENQQYVQSCMDILVILARFSPFLLCGAEEELVSFLKDDSEIIKEGALHVLAKAGGTIRENLAVSSSSIDLELERLCVEGSRRQAKYAVHALAAITKDDGLKSLSVLYKRLVNMLEEKTYLPAVLQCLGCIAQTAMPVFETRESEIVEFIHSKILRCNNKAEDNSHSSWENKSEVCLLKIYGIKALVKSYLPIKDAHLRSSIDNLLGILKSILCFGEVSEEIESSAVDKTHLKLAAAKAILRLSRQWDDKIPVDVFHLTLRILEISYPQAKTLFLIKVHQYIKDRLLDAKYACSFLLDMTVSKPFLTEEVQQNLTDIIQMCEQTKARQISMQSDAASLTLHPEYMLAYLVHVLAHHYCPDIDQCKDVKAYELIYRQLYCFISMLVHKVEDVNSEANNKEQTSLSVITSIFQSIKLSEDAVDATKSKISHAICDLGLLITQRLLPKDGTLEELSVPVSLPHALYKLNENKEGDSSMATEWQTWLSDTSVATHFEALQIENNAPVSEKKSDEHLDVKANENGGTAPSPEKTAKAKKSQRTKTGKIKKNKSSPAETMNTDNAVDILKMVRDINLDNLGGTKLESSNGHKHSPSKIMKMYEDHGKGKKRKGSDAAPVIVPKRQRSSTKSAFKSPKSASKISLKGSRDDSDQASDTDEDKVVGNKPDLLSSPTQKKRSTLLQRKGKGSGWGYSDEDHEVEEANNGDMKSGTGSTKKRKRKSMTGLIKCTTKERRTPIGDLIGYRIKVWWPMDKKYYGGTVKSYDPIKKKHVILYDDDDVEVLRLDREKWQLIDNAPRSTKKRSSAKSPRGKTFPQLIVCGLSTNKSRDFVGSSQSKKVTIVKGKRSSRNKSKQEQGASKSLFGETEKKKRSPLHKTGSADEMETDEEDVKWGADSDSEKESPKHGMDSNEEKSISEGKAESQSQDAEKTDEDARSNLNEKEAESTDSSRGEADSDSKENHDTEDDGMKLVNDDELSENEPLSNWKNKVGKSSSKQVK